MLERTKEDRINYWKGFIKDVASSRGLNLTTLTKELNTNFDRNSSLASFSARLSRGTITLLELSEILDTLDYSIQKVDVLEKLKPAKKF